MASITIYSTTVYANAGVSSKDYYYLTSGKQSSADSPAASNITWTLPRPNLPWAAIKINSVVVNNVICRNTGTAVKDSSWCFRTLPYGAAHNSNLAYYNGNVVWRYCGTNNGNWVPREAGTVTYNNIIMTTDALGWILQELRGGRDIYYSATEIRSVNGNITTSSDDRIGTYQTRTYTRQINMVIDYEITSNTRYYDGTNWNIVLPRYCVDASTISQSRITYPSGAMTSNSSQNCVAASSSQYNNNWPAWRAFDKSSTTNCFASSTSDTADWLQLTMPEPLYNIQVELTNRNDASYASYGATSGIIYGSNDEGSTLTQIGSFSGRDGATRGYTSVITCNNSSTPYSTIRLAVTSHLETYVAIGEMSISGTRYPTSGKYWMPCIAKRWDGSAWVQV